MKRNNWLYLVFLIVLVISVALNIGMYRYIKKVPEVRSDTVEVVRWDTITDTLPEIRYEKITKVIRIPMNDTIFKVDTVTNEIEMPVVQRTYTDDSTYTAFVSGVKVDSFPRLDSIMVRQKTVERTVTNTLYRKRHWHIGVGATGGVSVVTGKPDVVAGFFAGYTF